MGLNNKPNTVYQEFMAQSKDDDIEAFDDGEAPDENERIIVGTVYFDHELSTRLNEKESAPLEVRVAKDIQSLTAGLNLDGETIHKEGKELPKKQFSIFDASYADAYDNALKKCPHQNTQNLLYNKEWYCEDCGKHFNQAEYKKIMSKRNPFGFIGF
jgi:hypothetical protein